MKTIWGNEYKISESVKILDAQRPLSIQKHEAKTEIWFAISESFLTIEDEFVRLMPGDSIEIKPGTLHGLLCGKVLEIVDKPDDGTIRIFDWNRKR